MTALSMKLIFMRIAGKGGECKEQQKLCGAGLDQVLKTSWGSPAEFQCRLRRGGQRPREGLGPRRGVGTSPKADAAVVRAG